MHRQSGEPDKAASHCQAEPKEVPAVGYVVAPGVASKEAPVQQLHIPKNAVAGQVRIAASMAIDREQGTHLHSKYHRSRGKKDCDHHGKATTRSLTRSSKSRAVRKKPVLPGKETAGAFHLKKVRENSKSNFR